MTWRQCYKTFLSVIYEFECLLKLARKKHSSLLQKFVNYRQIKFYNIGPWRQCYKTFFVRNLRIFVQIYSVCQTRLEELSRDKHSSLLQKFVNYRQIKFYNIGPWRQCYKTFFVRNLRIFVQIYSVCQTKLEELSRNKHSSLLQKFINYRQMKFYNIGPCLIFPTF